MPNRILHVGVHDLRRTANGLEVVLAQRELPVQQTTQRVVDSLDEKYNRRTSKAHGRFSDDAHNYPTPSHFAAYIDPTEGDFAAFTSSIMSTLHAKARSVPNAGAGHVFFAHVERDGREFMLIAIVNEKLSAALTNDFEVQDVVHLDLDGFRFAGRVDVTAWQAGEDRYIGFLRGQGDVAEYFKEFLACVSTISDKRSTEEVVSALKDYADAQSMPSPSRDEFLSRAKTIMERTARAEETLEFQAFANELVPSNPDALTDYLGAPDRRLGDGFRPNTRALNALVKFRARTSSWAIEIDRSAFRDGEVIYDRENNALTIAVLPPALVAELRAEFEDDAEH